MQVQEYMVEQAFLEEERLTKQDQSHLIDEHANMVFNEQTGFDDRINTVMKDLIAGRHITQIEPQHPGLFRSPDPEQDDEDPTETF